MEQSHALAIFAALAHETRLAVFQRLVEVGHDGVPAGELAAYVGVRPNTLSNHLNILTAAKLVKPGRSGRIIRYSADYEVLQTFMRFMIQDCCNGRAELCAPLLSVLAKSDACDPAERNASNLGRR